MLNLDEISVDIQPVVVLARLTIENCDIVNTSSYITLKRNMLDMRVIDK
jgi:hypothetical protein